MKKQKFGLLSSSILYGFGGAAQRLISFILLPIFTHYLTPTDYGVVGLLVSLPALLLPVFSLGLSASISVCYFAAENQAGRRTVILTGRLITYISAGIMLALALLELDLVTRLAVGDLEYRLHTLVAVVTVALNVLCLPLQLEQQFSGRPLEFVIISLAGAVLASMGGAAAVIVFELGGLGLLIGNLLGQLFVCVLLMLPRKGTISGGKVSLGVAKELLKHGMPMLPSFVLLFILQNGVRWPLERGHGIDAVGLFTLGSSLGAAITLFTTGFVAAWMPWAMAQSDRWAESRQIVANRLSQYLISGGFLVLLFFCFAQPALQLLTPTHYFGAWVVVGLSAASNLLISIFSLLLPPVYMAKKVSLVLVAQGIAAAVTVGSAYFLLDFGILGAALAVFLGGVSLVMAQVVVNVKLTGIQSIPFDWVPLGLIVMVLGLASWATFYLSIADLFDFALHAVLLVLVVGGMAIWCLPDKKSLLSKISRGLR